MELKKAKMLKYAIVAGLLLIALNVVLSKYAKHVLKITPELANALDSATEVKIVKLSLRDSLVNYALQLLNTPYVEGSCGLDGFDCSGFVYFVFKHFNIDVPRSSILFKTFGKEVPINKVKKGDILVFLSPTRNEIGHVGIVTKANGMESDFIHASSGGEMKVKISSLNQDGYRKRFVKAVNVLED